MSDNTLRLTPAARQALDEIVADYKQQILLRAEDSASRLSGTAEEISLHDVFNGFKEIQVGQSGRSNSSVDAILKVYVLIGALIATGGAFSYFFRGIFSSLSFEQKLAALAAFGGLAISIVSSLLLKLRRQKTVGLLKNSYERDEAGLLGEFVSRWSELELTLRDRAARQLGESRTNVPISSIMYELANRKVLSEVELARLKEILSTRNNLVHSNGFADRSTLTKAIADIKSLSSKLHSF